MNNKYKRVSVVTGHYGSGKSNIALNMAVDIRNSGAEVTIVDLDIVNPYFRSADCEKLLDSMGIELIKPIFANTNLDMPALPASVDRVFNDKSRYFVVDVGGDDAGAVALGRYNKGFLLEEYDMYYCINKYRYLTKDHSEAVLLLGEIERESRLGATKLINNSNLGDLTTKEDVENSFIYAEEVSKSLNLPIAFTSVLERIYDEFTDKESLFKLNIYIDKY